MTFELLGLEIGNKTKEWGWDRHKKAKKFNIGKVWVRKCNLELTPFFKDLPFIVPERNCVSF